MFEVCKLKKEICPYCATDKTGQQRCGFVSSGDNYIIKFKKCPKQQRDEEKKKRALMRK